MNENPPNPPAQQTEIEVERERTKQLGIAGWTAGMSAFFAAAALSANPTWPVAAGIAAVAAMVAVVCKNILRR